MCDPVTWEPLDPQPGEIFLITPPWLQAERLPRCLGETSGSKTTAASRRIAGDRVLQRRGGALQRPPCRCVQKGHALYFLMLSCTLLLPARDAEGRIVIGPNGGIVWAAQIPVHPSSLKFIAADPEIEQRQRTEPADAGEEVGAHPAPRVEGGMDGANVVRLEDHRRVPAGRR